MNLFNTLGQLENAELVHPAKERNVEYLFKHALTQETAYRSLLKTQRRDLHRAIAQAIEETFPNQRGKLSDVLAYHWELAEVPDRARRYLFRAAQNALRSYANQEALALLTRALAQSQGAKPQDLAALYEARAQVLESLGRYEQAIADYQAALPLVRQAGSAVDECRMLSRIALDLSLCGKYDQAVAIVEDAKALALEQQDQMAVLRAYLVQGLAIQAKGEVSQATLHFRTMLVGSQLSDQVVMEGESWYYLGVQYDLLGRFGRAALCASKAAEIKKGLADFAGEILALYLRARAEGGCGHYTVAFDALEQAHALAEEIHSPLGLAEYPQTRAWLAAELGDWETAYEIDRAGLDVARQAYVQQPQVNTLLNLYLDCVMLGKLAQAEEYARQLQPSLNCPEFGYHIWRWQLRYADAHARLLIAQSRYDDALTVVAQLLAQAEHTQSIKYHARGLVLRAQINLTRRASHATRDDLLTTCRLADVMGYAPVRLQARLLLAQMYAPSDHALARDYSAQAAQIAQDIRQCLHHAELRAAFERGMGTWVEHAG